MYDNNKNQIKKKYPKKNKKKEIIENEKIEY